MLQTLTSPGKLKERLPASFLPIEIKVGKEVSSFMKILDTKGLWQKFKNLRVPNPLISLWWIARGIALTVSSTWLFLNYPWAVVIAVPLVSRSIRSFGNQVHDASHGNIFRNNSWNTFILKYFLMPIMFYDGKIYCKDHQDHHAVLGSHHDPDVILYNAKIKSTDSEGYAFWKVIKPHFLNFRVWRSSAFGDLFTMRRQVLLRVLTWWGAILFIIGLLFGWDVTAYFILLWMLSRATFYHFIKVFAELCDHAFLAPVSIVDYTRSMPKTWLSFFLHPENDNFHIAHHLFPKIPMPNLPRAHKILMNIPEYKNGQHLSSYFFGKRSVIRALIGRI